MEANELQSRWKKKKFERKRRSALSEHWWEWGGGLGVGGVGVWSQYILSSFREPSNLSVIT